MIFPCDSFKIRATERIKLKLTVWGAFGDTNLIICGFLNLFNFLSGAYHRESHSKETIYDLGLNGRWAQNSRSGENTKRGNGQLIGPTRLSTTVSIGLLLLLFPFFLPQRFIIKQFSFPTFKYLPSQRKGDFCIKRAILQINPEIFIINNSHHKIVTNFVSSVMYLW